MLIRNQKQLYYVHFGTSDEKYCVQVAVSMYTAAAVIATEEQMPKLSKLVTLWETKSKFFEEEVLEKMRDFKESAAKYR